MQKMFDLNIAMVGKAVETVSGLLVSDLHLISAEEPCLVGTITMLDGRKIVKLWNSINGTVEFDEQSRLVMKVQKKIGWFNVWVRNRCGNPYLFTTGHFDSEKIAETDASAQSVCGEPKKLIRTIAIEYEV